MKRIWFAVIFLLLAAALCIGEQMYLQKVYTETDTKLRIACAYAAAGDDRRLALAVEDVRHYWKKHNDILYLTADHAALDGFSGALRALDAKDKNIKSALAEASALLYVYYQNQRVTPSNIF